MRYILLLSLFMGLHSHAENLTLKDALNLAEQNSPQVQRASSARDESYWKKIESYSAFLPTITGTVNYMPTHKYVLTDFDLGSGPISIPGIVPTTVYGLQARYNLFDGLTSTNRRYGAQSSEKAAIDSLNWARFQTEREITLQFYRAVAARALKQVADSNLKTLEDHLQDSRLLKKSGLGTNYDVLRVEVQVSEASSEVLNTMDDIETASGHLAELLGMESAPEAVGKLPELPSAIADSVKEVSPLRRPDLSALRNQVDALAYQKKAASTHWVPSISLIGQYQYYNNLNDAVDDWHSFRNAYEVGLNLTWNLFEGFNSEAKNRQALEERVQMEKTLKIATLKAQQELSLWKRKYKYFYSVYKARQSDIGKSQEAVRLAKAGRRAGSRTNTDLLDAETELFRAQAGAVHAQLGVIEALINLELSTGQKLYEFN